MKENFEGRDLTGSVFHNTILASAVFEEVNLGEATFHNVNLAKAMFNDVNLGGATIRNANLGNLKIEDAYIGGLTVFGFDVNQLIEAECDRRDPERVRLRMADVYDLDCIREVLTRLDVVRASFTSFLRSLESGLLFTRPAAEEWSVMECLRHMLFAEDLYFNRWLLRNDQPWLSQGLLPAFLAGQPVYTRVGSQPLADLEVVLKA